MVASQSPRVRDKTHKGRAAEGEEGLWREGGKGRGREERRERGRKAGSERVKGRAPQSKGR